VYIHYSIIAVLRHTCKLCLWIVEVPALCRLLCVSIQRALVASLVYAIKCAYYVSSSCCNMYTHTAVLAIDGVAMAYSTGRNMLHAQPLSRSIANSLYVHATVLMRAIVISHRELVLRLGVSSSTGQWHVC
jgi:hypothetical protein